DEHAAAAITQKSRAGGIQANDVAGNGVTVRRRASDFNAIISVAGDDIPSFRSGCGRGAANGVTRYAVGIDAIPGIAHVSRASRVRADVIALYDIAGGAAAMDFNAIRTVARNNVAFISGGAADGVIDSQFDLNAISHIAKNRCAIFSYPNEV